MKVVVLDRDGTIIEDKYPCHINDLKLLPGARETIQRLCSAGYGLFVLSNQSAVGKELITKEEVDRVNLGICAKTNAIIHFLICPHRQEDNCFCRKPNPGLYLLLDNQFGPFDWSDSWSVGDSVRDLEAAKKYNTKIRTILIGGEQNSYTDYYAPDICSAATIILGGIQCG
jgi:histidinol-phosphate phosphatase family protein